MELESEDQTLQSIPSISGVSQKQVDSRESCSKKRPLRHDFLSFSDKNAIQATAVTNSVTSPETKTETAQIVSHLTRDIMPEGILAETDEPMTKVINLNSNLLSSDFPVMKVERQSPLQKNSISHRGSNHITKEEVKIQDLANIIDNDADRRNKNYETLEKKRADNERPECSQNSHQAACKTHIPFCEKPAGFDAAVPEALTSAKEVTVQEEVCEALDLSLPKKKVRDNKEKCKWVLDSGYEGSLFMEVDEIEDDIQHIEVEQDEDDEECWFPLKNDAHANSYHLKNSDSVSLTAIPSSLSASFLPLEPKDTLLIDDQGIPYTLTSDGQKVPQIDLSEMPKVPSEEISPGIAEFDDEATVSVQDADPAQEFSSDLPLGDSSLGLSQDTLRVETTSPHDSIAEAKSEALPTISSLPSLPIQIVASNTESNTPILLLPQSQLQSLSSSTTDANPRIMALSLPLALAQNTQSSSVFLLLSSPQASCGIQSSSSSGQLSQVSSTSSVALPVASSSPGLNPEPVSCTTTSAELSGQDKPCNFSSALTSPTASTSTASVTSTCPVRQIKTEACSDTPTSFQEALLRLAVSAVQKAETQLKPTEIPSVDTPSSCEATQSGLPPETHALEELSKTEQVSSPISETASIKVDQTDSLLSPDSGDGHLSPSTTSPRESVSPIFPTNHPKNQDAQALGPRRILYCQYCPRVFYYLSDLERHSITHSQSKPHVCQLCGKAFKRSSHLERHKHIHTGQRNFMCQLCPRRFREAAELTRHQRVHTGEKPFQCLLCHMRFAERNTLRRHTKRKHQGQQQEAMNTKVKPETEGVSLLDIQGQQEENAEWYSSTMTEMDSDNDTGGE